MMNNYTALLDTLLYLTMVSIYAGAMYYLFRSRLLS